MKNSFFKRFISVMLTSALAASIFSLAPASVGAASAFVASMNNKATADAYFNIFESGYNNDFVGKYSFDMSEGALSLKYVDYINAATGAGGHYRFCIRLKNNTMLSSKQSWMVVKYKTDTTSRGALGIYNCNSSTLVLDSNVSRSKGEYVYSVPVDINAPELGDNNYFARLRTDSWDVITVNISDRNAKFYIKEICFFESKAAAQAYTGSGELPEGGSDTNEIVASGVFEGSTYTHNGFTIGTSLYVPKTYSTDKEYALLVYLHGAGDRGSGALWNGDTGSAAFITKDVIEQYGDEFIIFAPRCPSGYQWVQSSWTPGTYNYSTTPISKPMSAAISYIYDEILEKYSIDDSRIYVTGDSMGGGGTWDIILREPDLFAAALPTCGYNDPTMAPYIREDLAIWVHHTAQDDVVNVVGDRMMTASLKNLGRNVIYTEYDGNDPADRGLFKSTSESWAHYAWEAVRSEADEILEWLVAQKKSDTEKVSKFTDVDATASYFTAVNYVTEAGLFQGISETEFDPDTVMTRAMFVTVLGRFAGVDTAEYTGTSFTDVNPVYGKWYAPYVEWASKNNIVNGMGDGTFGVNSPITVEQACTILGRFIEHKSAPNDTGRTLSSYSDGNKTASWAKEGLEWAVANSVYLGKGNKLNPNAEASRALVAEIFCAYNTIFGK